MTCSEFSTFSTIINHGNKKNTNHKSNLYGFIQIGY